MTKLVRYGIDQCQRALKKLEVKPDLQLENRGLVWDKLQDTVEEILREMRALLKSLDNLEIESDLDEVDSDDGWAEPMDSPLKSSPENFNDPLASQENISPVDLHPYASRKRKGRTSQKSNSKITRKEPAKKLSRHKPIEGQELIANISKSQHDDEDEKLVNLVDPVSSRSRNSKSLVSKSKRKYTGRAVKRSDGRRRLASETAVERMERFLLLNTAHREENSVDEKEDQEDSPKSLHSSIRGRRFIQTKSGSGSKVDEPSVTRRNKRREQGVSGSNKNDSCASIPQSENESLSSYLFQGLRSRRRGEVSPGIDHSGSAIESSRTVVDVCGDLRKVFPQLSSCSLFKELLFIVCTSGGEVESPNVFVVAMSLLKDFGCLTIQELVSQDSPQLASYVALYVFILELLKRNLHRSLSAQHGIAYKLFGASHCKFIEFLFLLFLDAVYALAHPDAWVVKVSNRRQIFETLAPLRDALGEHLALIEQAFNHIDTRLGNQVWRLVSSRRVMFVSSIGPDSWKLYIEQAIEPEAITQSRWRQIGNVPCIPRVEIESLWRVLAFLAASTHTQEPGKESRYRWKFIPEIFSNGVFRMSGKNGSPSQSHLQTVSEDIVTLSSLLSSDVMGPLPRKDSVVVDIIMKSLILHADALWHDDEFREAHLPAINDGKSELKRESSRWESWRDLSSATLWTFAPIAKTELLKELVCAWRPNEPFAFFANRPASGVLHSNLVLQFAWMTSVQAESIARTHHCEQSFGALAKFLQGESKHSFHDGTDNSQNNGDTFQDAFPDHSIMMCKAGLPDSRRALFLQECAAYICLMARILTSTAQQGMGQKDSVLLEIIKKTWETLGYGEMGEALEISRSTSFDILRPYVMGKVLDFLSSWVLGIIPATENGTAGRTVPDFTVDQDAICFIASSLTRCLEVSSYSGNSEIIYSIARMTEKILHSIYQAFLAKKLDQQCVASVADVLLTGSIRASINTISSLVKATFCGAEEDICLLSVLSLVRTTLSLHRVKLSAIENISPAPTQVQEAPDSSDQAEEEIWGDLNDAELLRMMESVEGGSSQDDTNSGMLQSCQQLCSALSESLKYAIPSLRYEISHSDEDALRMSPHGKLLVSRRLKAICTTLISILVSEQGLRFSSLADLVGLQVSVSLDDEEYRRKVLLYCSHGLCNSIQSPRAHSLIHRSSSSMVSVFINTLLDATVLQNVPSCNFDRLHGEGCDALKRKAIDDFLKFSSGNSSLRKKTAKIWTFGRELGNALALSTPNGDGVSLFNQIGEDFSNLNWDTDNHDVCDLPCSLEKEYLGRFRCIRGIISTYRQFNIIDKSFSELCAEIIAQSCEGLLRILKLLHVEEIASKGSPGASYAKFRLTELFRCHAELHASALAWIFREGSHVPTTFFTNIWTIICNDFVVPIISSDTLAVYSCIEKTYASISEVTGVPPLNLPKLVDLEANGECRKILSSNLIRYSKEILLPMLLSESPGLQILDKFLSSAVRDSSATSKSICRIFFKDTGLASSSLTENGDSKLSQQLGIYWESLQTDHPLDSKLEGSLVTLKQHAVEMLVATAKRNKRGRIRQGALSIINSILRRERKAVRSERLKLEVVCSLVRSLPLILKESLLESAVDEEMVAMIYKCVHGISKLRALSMENNEDENFAELCAAKSLQFEHEDPKTSLSAKYVTIALTWFEAIGNIILGQEVDRERMRLQLREANGDGWSSWESISCSAPLARISRETKTIEDQLFPSLNPNRVLHNIYAAAKRSQPVQDTVEWAPSDSTRQIIQMFLTFRLRPQ